MLPELARNPLVLACATGIAWNALHAPMPGVLSRVLELIGSAAVPLGLLAVGAGLHFEKATLPPIAIAWWHGVKLVALPATAYVLAALLDLSSLERQVAVLMAAVPTATSAYILATRMNAPGAPVALLISTGTLLAAITLPIWLQLVSE
jgi:predicted permease